MNVPEAAGSPPTWMSLADSPNSIFDVLRSEPESVLTTTALKFGKVYVQLLPEFSVIVGVAPMIEPTSAVVAQAHVPVPPSAEGIEIPDGISNGGNENEGMLIGGMVKFGTATPPQAATSKPVAASIINRRISRFTSP